MRHFPIFLDLRGRKVVVTGSGECAAAKLRLILKTEARVIVLAPAPAPAVRGWAAEGRLTLIERPMGLADAAGAALIYAANADAAEDQRVRRIAEIAGVPVNVVDDLETSAFITPAIVDRDPVTVAIGTEGAAPMLARRIKAQIEESLSPNLGALARIGSQFRAAAKAIPAGRARRGFWTRYFTGAGARAHDAGGAAAVEEWLRGAIAQPQAPIKGRVALIGAGPGDPELLTLKARKRLHMADVVIRDGLVDPRILELARREAEIIEVGETSHSPAWRPVDINALMIEKAAAGLVVARLESGDPAVFGRLDEEIDALDAAGIAWEIIPGIATASAATASAGLSLVRRGGDAAIMLLNGHGAAGFVERDWRALARPDAAFAVSIEVRAAGLVRGRLLMRGARPETPATVIGNVSRPNGKIAVGTLGRLPEIIDEAGITGSAVLFIGPAPRAARAALTRIPTRFSTEPALAAAKGA